MGGQLDLRGAQRHGRFVALRFAYEQGAFYVLIARVRKLHRDRRPIRHLHGAAESRRDPHGHAIAGHCEGSIDQEGDKHPAKVSSNTHVGSGSLCLSGCVVRTMRGARDPGPVAITKTPGADIHVYIPARQLVPQNAEDTIVFATCSRSPVGLPHVIPSAERRGTCFLQRRHPCHSERGAARNLLFPAPAPMSFRARSSVEPAFSSAGTHVIPSAEQRGTCFSV